MPNRGEQVELWPVFLEFEVVVRTGQVRAPSATCVAEDGCSPRFESGEDGIAKSIGINDDMRLSQPSQLLAYPLLL